MLITDSWLAHVACTLLHQGTDSTASRLHAEIITTNPFPPVLPQCEMDFISVERVQEYMGLEPEGKALQSSSRDGPRATTPPPRPPVVARLASHSDKGAVSFRDVRFRCVVAASVVHTPISWWSSDHDHTVCPAGMPHTCRRSCTGSALTFRPVPRWLLWAGQGRARAR